MDKIDIKSLNANELSENLAYLSLPKFRVTQIYEWVRRGVASFEEMTNIPAALRQKLDERFYFADVKIARKLTSKLDGTVKYLFELADGEFIESVFMSYHHGYTVCISTQVGCRMGWNKRKGKGFNSRRNARSDRSCLA